VNRPLHRLRRARPGARDDRGAATLFVVGLAVMLLVVAGLVVDGGLAINARSTAFDIAEQAARAGAREVDIQHLRETQEIRVDPVAGRDAAASFADQALAGNGTANVQVVGNEVTVTIDNRQVKTALLGLIGVQQYTINNARATARAAVGIENEIGGPP